MAADVPRDTLTGVVRDGGSEYWIRPKKVDDAKRVGVQVEQSAALADGSGQVAKVS